jgi:hypothetical protein
LERLSGNEPKKPVRKARTTAVKKPRGTAVRNPRTKK